ncbi:hypothetical protein VTK26DRAFT_792 [Humicola hyalothermophila]
MGPRTCGGFQVLERGWTSSGSRRCSLWIRDDRDDDARRNVLTEWDKTTQGNLFLTVQMSDLDWALAFGVRSELRPKEASSCKGAMPSPNPLPPRAWVVPVRAPLRGKRRGPSQTPRRRAVGQVRYLACHLRRKRQSTLTPYCCRALPCLPYPKPRMMRQQYHSGCPKPIPIRSHETPTPAARHGNHAMPS